MAESVTRGEECDTGNADVGLMRQRLACLRESLIGRGNPTLGTLSNTSPSVDLQTWLASLS